MIYIEDNFFKDPFKVRRLALKEEYVKDINLKNTFPGLRSINVSQEIKDFLQTSARYITKKPTLVLIESSYQVITKEYQEGQFHHDGDFADYTSINYLSLEPPSHSGTEVCDTTGHPALTGVVPMKMWEHHLSLKEQFYNDPQHLWNGYKYARMRKKVNSMFNSVAQVPNKFNRWLLFSSERHHRSQIYYGDSPFNARLTIVSFFK